MGIGARWEQRGVVRGDDEKVGVREGAVGAGGGKGGGGGAGAAARAAILFRSLLLPYPALYLSARL